VLGSTLEVISPRRRPRGKARNKALAVDTEVPTPSGWTTMGRLVVGDAVFDECGTPTTVVAATEVVDDRPCYEVLLCDGTRFVSDGAQEWVTRTRSERTRELTRPAGRPSSSPRRFGPAGSGTTTS